MNIAFPAILLFFLLSPGFVFHRFYQAREVRAADLTPFSATVLTAITFAVFVNAAVMAVATHWGGYLFHLGEILRLLVGGASSGAEAALSPVYRRLDDHPFEPLCFFIATNLLAIILACLWRFGVQGFRLDHPSSPLYSHIRPPAPWYYLFSGMDVIDKAPDAVVVSAIVALKDAAYLYTGLLVGYELTDKGELDRLILSNAARRRLADDRNVNDSSSVLSNHERYYPIEGDCFVLRSSEYTTLNIKFLVIEDIGADDLDEERD